MDSDALRRAFRDYARVLLGPYDVGSLLYRLVDQAVEVLEVDGAGVSIAQEGEALTFVAGTSASVSAIEQEQITKEASPLNQAYRVGDPVAIDDLEADERWPEYRTAALVHGLRAVAALPMPVSERRIGALGLYRTHPHAWTDAELETAQVLADMASGAILNASDLDESRTLASQLQQALDSRVVIEQAKGVLAERHDISPHDAFQRVRNRARRERRRVHDVAEDVVEDDLDL